MENIKYTQLPPNDDRRKRSWKYELAETYVSRVNITPPEDLAVQDTWVALDKYGQLTMKEHYCWDGPSGPAIDTVTFMRGSLVHDALYQLIRVGLLPMSKRKAADQEMQRICREDGMWWPRTVWTYWAVRLFGWVAFK